MTDPIKAKIQELCPDVRSDTRGYQQIQLDRAYQEYLDICKEVSKEDSSRTFASAAMAFDRVKKLSNALAVFQDEPITLAVVLRAIEKGNPSALTNVHVELNGNICVRKSGQENFHMEAYWNLEQDNYDQQSDETKQFIGQLLNVV